MKGNTWTVAEAKAKFSEIIERARSGEPQTITRNRRTAAVVVVSGRVERKVRDAAKPRGVFLRLPASGVRPEGQTVKDRAREIDL